MSRSRKFVLGISAFALSGALFTVALAEDGGTIHTNSALTEDGGTIHTNSALTEDGGTIHTN